MYKLRTFTDDLVIMLGNPSKGTELLMAKLKEFSALVGFKIKTQRTKMLTKI